MCWAQMMISPGLNTCKRHNKETGPALVGIELQSRKDYELLMKKHEKSTRLIYTEINKNDTLFGYWFEA